MITSAIQQIVNTDRTELKDFLNEVDKLHKTDEAVTAKIANNPELAKALTDLSALLALFCGLVSILGSWLSIAWLVSCPRVVAKSLVLLRLASFR
jgi:hypothetical protein